MKVTAKLAIYTGVLALAASPALALPTQVPTNPGTGHRPDSPGSGNPNSSTHPQHPARSHRCRAHKVAYVASGALVSQSLTKNSDGTYSSDLTVHVTRTNHHAKGDRGVDKTYTLDHAKVTFGLADRDNDGTVDQTDLRPGDRTTVIGKTTTLAKKCDHSGFTAQTTIRKVVFNQSPQS